MADGQAPEPPAAGKDRLREHHYDGIQEYDNSLPRWWLALFVLTIGWAAFYVLHYHLLGTGKLGRERLAGELQAETARQAGRTTGPPSADLLAQLVAEPARSARGKAVYASSGCASCHGPEADGRNGGADTAGPNLRDRWTLHGAAPLQVWTLIAEGSPNALMPAQKHSLGADDITALVAWLAGLPPKEGRKPDPTREKETP